MSTHVFDATSWSQERKNGVIAACVELLHLAAITHSGVSRASAGSDIVVTVASPSSDPTSTLAQAAVETTWDAQEAARVASTQAVQAEEALRRSEQGTNPIFGLTWSQIEGRFQTHVDAVTASRDAMSAASNLAQAKTAAVASDNATLAFLADIKRLVRLLRARGHLDRNL